MNDTDRKHIEMMAAQIMGGMFADSEGEWTDCAKTAVEMALRIRNRLDTLIEEGKVK